MKQHLTFALCVSSVFSACGVRQQQASKIESDKLEGVLMGVTTITASNTELRDFLDGKDVPALQRANRFRAELTAKFDAPHSIHPALAEYAWKSPTGLAIIQSLENVIQDEAVTTEVPKLLMEETQKGPFTIYQLLTDYPSQILKVNLLKFWNEQKSLEKNLATLEAKFPPGAQKE